MQQVPGKDNYNGSAIRDRLPDGTAEIIDFNDGAPLDAHFYNRFYGLSDNDAMGSSNHRRGWSDRYLFVAKTRHEKVSSVDFKFESAESGETLQTEGSRYSYAIPLEIIYLTPLSKWNPFGVAELSNSDLDAARTGECGGKAFNGWTSSNAYFTPFDFFEHGVKNDEGAGDTASATNCALGADGAEHGVMPSGHWITFPEIAGGVGKVRQRFPIFPVHKYGTVQYKEVKALQGVLLDDAKYDDDVHGISFFTKERDLKHGFEVALQGGDGGHYHTVSIPSNLVRDHWYDEDDDDFTKGDSFVLEAESDLANGHVHTVRIWRDRVDDNANDWTYTIQDCRFGTLSDSDVDNPWQSDTCQDGHTQIIRD